MNDRSTSTGAGPVATIVVAAFDAAETLADTIESVLAQTVAAWELIIVDDGSADETLALAREYAGRDGRIRVLTQPNAGTGSARNAGFALARGTWWCFLDADDTVFPEYLERMVEFIGAHPGYDIYSCNAELVLRGGETRLMWRGAQWTGLREVTAIEQLADSSISAVTLFRPEVFESTGGFRAVYSEDYDFWLRALVAGYRHLFNPEVLWRCRRREGSKTTALVREAESLLEIHRHVLGMEGLSADQRAAAQRAVVFSEARIGRRRLEEALLEGEFTGARGAYIRIRRAFPGFGKYAVGFVMMMVSPSLYARIKSRRMI